MRYSHEVSLILKEMKEIACRYDNPEITEICVFTALYDGVEWFKKQVNETAPEYMLDDLILDLLEEHAVEGQQSSENIDYSQEVENIFCYAELMAKEEQHTEVSLEHLVFSLLLNGSREFKSFIATAKINVEKITMNLLEKEEQREDNEIGVNSIFEIPRSISSFVTVLNTKRGIGKECAISGREKELDKIWNIMLKKTKRNVILLGEAGVGKSSIVYKLASSIVTGDCPETFKNAVVISLDVNAIIAGTKFRGDAEQRFKEFIDFIEENEDVIVFIDEIHMIIGAGGSEGNKTGDLANTLKPLLASDNSRIIGATTTEEYEKYFSEDGALRRRFQTIVVKEPKTTEVYDMLKDTIKQLESFHSVSISKEMVDFIILQSSCFNYETRNPDRTKDLIDLAMATARRTGKKEVDESSVTKNFDMYIEKFHNMPKDSLMATAYHEAGHYVMHVMSGRLVDFKTIAVSIIPTENYMGVNVLDNTDIPVISDMNYFIDYIASMLAGRVAESLYTGYYNAGARGDLRKATEQAYNVVTKYGMGNGVCKNYAYFQEMKNERITDAINVEVDSIIRKAYQRAEEVLKTNRPLLEEIAKQLCQKGILRCEELEKIVLKFQEEEAFA